MARSKATNNRSPFKGAAKFLETLFAGLPGSICVLGIDPSDPKNTRWRMAATTAAALEAVHEINHGYLLNNYVRPVTYDGARALKTNLYSARALTNDLDGVPRDQAEAKLASLPIAPTMAVYTGGGVHPWWLLNEPIDLRDLEQFIWYESALKGLAQAIGGDPASTDAGHAMRIPDFLNYPSRKKREAGRTVAPVELIAFHPERRYPREAFAAFVEIGRPLVEERRRRDVDIAGADWPEWFGDHEDFDSLPPHLAVELELDEIALRRFKREFELQGKDRSESVKDFAIGCHFVRLGFEASVVYVAIKASRLWYVGDEKCYERDDHFRRTALKTYAETEPAEQVQENLDEYFEDLTAGASEEPHAEKPIIVLTGRQLDELAKQIAVAVASANKPPTLFRRGGEVVRTFRDEEGELAIRPQINQRFLHVASSAARYYVREGKTSLKPAKQIGQIATLALEELTIGKHLPPLRGVVTHPLLRHDGSILARSGYDQETGLHVDLRAEVEIDVPDRPTGQEIRAARELILEPLADFPFVDDASRANAAAIILTLLTRELFDLAPLFAISAPTAGSGKGLLTRIVTLIPRGVDPALMSQPGDEDEWRKRIFSILRSGRDVCVLDNVRRVLDSASLLGLLTSTKWEDRVLGVSAQAAFENRTTWIATGNNLPIRGSEMLRRTVWVTINPECVRPDKREDFKHPDLPTWVRESRGRLLAAAFTLCRAWITAGRPAPTLARMGSFEQWQVVVGGILDVAGVEGFLGNANAAFEELEEEGAQWGAFLKAWHEYQGNAPITTKELADLMLSSDPVREALPEEFDVCDPNFRHKLGTALRDRVERRFPAPGGGEIWIKRKTVSAGRARWVVLRDHV